MKNLLPPKTISSFFRDYNRAFLRAVGAQAQAEGAKASKNFFNS